jgi:uncharacterized protein (DUF2147 family)
MKLVILLLTAFLTLNLFAGDIVGKWKTIDDETKLPKSVVEITQAADGTYIGKIIKLFRPATEDQNPKCEVCEGALKGQPLIGMQIITGMKKEGNEFNGGTIFDPKKNKTYKCILKVEGTNLSVRGYIGFSLIGRTQTWSSFQE